MKLFSTTRIIIGAFRQSAKEGRFLELLAFSMRTLCQLCAIFFRRILPALFWKGCVWILATAWALKMPYEWLIGKGVKFAQKHLVNVKQEEIPQFGQNQPFCSASINTADFKAESAYPRATRGEGLSSASDFVTTSQKH